jgi:hypothetical protein
MELYKYKTNPIDRRLRPYFLALITLTCKRGACFNYGAPLICSNNHIGYLFHIQPLKYAGYHSVYPDTVIECFLVDIILVN